MICGHSMLVMDNADVVFNFHQELVELHHMLDCRLEFCQQSHKYCTKMCELKVKLKSVENLFIADCKRVVKMD